MIRVYNHDTRDDKKLKKPEFIEFLKELEEQYGPNNADIQIEKCAVIRNGPLNSRSSHAMTVVQLRNGTYYSFERFRDMAYVQLSVELKNVVYYRRGEIRGYDFSESHLETTWAEGNGSLLTTLQTIFFKGHFRRCYNILTNNCQQFAKLVYKHATIPGSKPYRMLRIRKCAKGELPPRPSW